MTVSQKNHLGSGQSAKRKQEALVWIPRVMGVLSIISSLSIMQHIWRHSASSTTVGGITTCPLSVQREVLLALSLFDILSSIAWAFASTPAPAASRICGAQGNAATCTAQGFFVQLGSTGAFYNTTLSILYLLTIRYGWREEKLRTTSKYFHLLAIVGLGMSFGGLPFYGHMIWGCYIRAPPLADSYVPLIMFSILPISIMTIVATVNMGLVYRHVQAHDAATNPWRLATTQSTTISMGDAVFWQSMVYLAGFYLVWPLFRIYNTLVADIPYVVYVLAVLLTPSQGLWNALAYFRPIIIAERLNRQREARRSRTADQRLSSESSLVLRLWNNKKSNALSPESSTEPISAAEHPLPLGSNPLSPNTEGKYEEASTGLDLKLAAVEQAVNSL